MNHRNQVAKRIVLRVSQKIRLGIVYCRSKVRTPKASSEKDRKNDPTFRSFFDGEAQVLFGANTIAAREGVASPGDKFGGGGDRPWRL